MGTRRQGRAQGSNPHAVQVRVGRSDDVAAVEHAGASHGPHHASHVNPLAAKGVDPRYALLEGLEPGLEHPDRPPPPARKGRAK
eukprot:3297433-Pyramimonas_sp.AAC.2